MQDKKKVFIHAFFFSLAIMKFIARKYDRKLYPDGEEQLRWAETAEGFLVDLRIRWGRLCYKPDFEKLKNDFKTGNPQQVSRHGAGAGQQGVGRVQTVLRGFWHGGGHGRLREPLPRLL